MTRDGKKPYAVSSVGGFLGIGTRLAVIRYDRLRFPDKKNMLPGETKDGLKMLPAFELSKSRSKKIGFMSRGLAWSSV